MGFSSLFLLSPVSEARSNSSPFPSTLGHVDGQNVVINCRAAAGPTARLPLHARDVVELKIDLIVAVGTVAGCAAQRASASIPISRLELPGFEEPMCRSSGFGWDFGAPPVCDLRSAATSASRFGVT